MTVPVNPVNLRGFVTTQKYLQGQTLREIEIRLGFDKGRLSLGAWFAVAMRLPNHSQFEFAGYTQVAGHHTHEQYGDLNSPASPEEKAIYLARKMNIIQTKWSLNGEKRLVKVVPMIGHSLQMSDDYQYPPGSGIPQWKITAWPGLPFKGICFVGDYPDGKFIPDEGYNPVRYR